MGSIRSDAVLTLEIRQGHVSAANAFDAVLNFFGFAGGEGLVGIEKGFQIALGGMQVACR